MNLAETVGAIVAGIVAVGLGIATWSFIRQLPAPPDR